MASKSKKVSSSNMMGMGHFKHHLLPSVAGGGVAYLLSGVAVLGLGVFAAVLAANALNHHLHKK